MSCLQAIYYHKFENAGILQILEKCHIFNWKVNSFSFVGFQVMLELKAMRKQTVLLKLHCSFPYQCMYRFLTEISNIMSTFTLLEFGRIIVIIFSLINFR